MWSSLLLVCLDEAFRMEYKIISHAYSFIATNKRTSYHESEPAGDTISTERSFCCLFE